MKFYLDSADATPEIMGKYEIAGVFGPPSQKMETFNLKNGKILQGEKTIGVHHIINSADSMEKALNEEILSNYTHILIETGDWHIIPLENLIAKYHGSSITLIATASTVEEINLLNNILELGVGGCLLKPNATQPLNELLERNSSSSTLELVKLTIDAIERIGNGDRVCVDTVSILEPGEGLLVGSAGALQALIEAEVEDSGFVNARPFRINAGVVASYLLNFEKTNYLSELQAGDTVMIVNREGQTRKEFVARVKIERRPLIVVRCSYDNQSYPVILQDAETVRLVTPNGSTRVDQLQVGDLILGYVSDKARHFGMAIEESLEEK